MIVTISLIAINIIVFVLMVISGASFFEPTTASILNWGGLSSELSLHGNQWWRLVSSMFVHIGIFHDGCLEAVLKPRFCRFSGSFGQISTLFQGGHIRSLYYPLKKSRNLAKIIPKSDEPSVLKQSFRNS